MIERDETNRIVFHHSLASTSSSAEIKSWHLERGFDDIGYHFVIRKNGSVEPGRNIRSIGAHAAGRNRDSIGVCFEGDFRRESPTEFQYDSALGVYHGLCRLYNKNLCVEFHRDLFDNPCPGELFDRGKLLTYLKRGEV